MIFYIWTWTDGYPGANKGPVRVRQDAENCSSSCHHVARSLKLKKKISEKARPNKMASPPAIASSHGFCIVLVTTCPIGTLVLLLGGDWLGFCDDGDIGPL